MTKFKKEIPEAAKRLQVIRKNEKLTQEEFGKVIGKSQPNIQKYESGELYIPTSIYKILHEKLAYSYEWLLSGTGRKKIVEPKKSSLVSDLKEINERFELLYHNYETLNKKINKLYRDVYQKQEA